MNAHVSTLHSLLLLVFAFALTAVASARVCDALTASGGSQTVMQAGLPLVRGVAAPAFDIEALPARDDVAFEVDAEFEVVVTAAAA